MVALISKRINLHGSFIIFFLREFIGFAEAMLNFLYNEIEFMDVYWA